RAVWRATANVKPLFGHPARMGETARATRERGRCRGPKAPASTAAASGPPLAAAGLALARGGRAVLEGPVGLGRGLVQGRLTLAQRRLPGDRAAGRDQQRTGRVVLLRQDHQVVAERLLSGRPGAEPHLVARRAVDAGSP